MNNKQNPALFGILFIVGGAAAVVVGVAQPPLVAMGMIAFIAGIVMVVYSQLS